MKGYSGESMSYKSYLQYPITADNVLEFISNENNRYILESNIKKGEFNVDENDDFNVIKTLLQLKVIDGYLVEFDDQFSQKECVYALAVNRLNRRITVCFRGSITLSDWKTDLNAWLKQIDPPSSPINRPKKYDIKVHAGFHDYLFDSTNKGTIKFDDILGQILQLYNENPEYKSFDLYITGHSLGGALTSLLGFFLVGSGKLHDVLGERPISVIAYASPQVGDRGFNDAYHDLQEEGTLRHLRVSNEGDLVPVSPPWYFGYTQTGVSLHLYGKKKMEIVYRNLKLFVFQLNCLMAKARHALKEYRQRLQKTENNDCLALFKNVDEFYKRTFLRKETSSDIPEKANVKSTQLSVCI